MLQQTQVKTVLPYYRRFLRAFPTLAALDRAPREEVLALWSGLGYYRRAENLKEAARRIMHEHGGKMPQDFEALYALPGIGSYTAGALLSIAFGQPYPALDGNVRRVLTRLFDVINERDLHEIAKGLVSPSRPGHFNQALMELGARVCLPREPNCPLCPLVRFCTAKKSRQLSAKKADGLPSSARHRSKQVDWPLVVIRHKRAILLHRRPQGGLLGGLWEVPGGERKEGETLEAALARHLNGLGGKVRPASLIGEIRHSITNRRIQAPVFVCFNDTKTPPPGPTWRWVSLSSLHHYPLSSLSLKAVRLLTEQGRRQALLREVWQNEPHLW
jgi:A/G-specific adenine glycosylase